VTLKLLLKHAVTLLDAHIIDGASLTAEVLLRHVLNLNRVQYYQQLDSEITSEQAAAFQESIERQIKGEPVAYITGHKEFYGLDFIVDSRVLIPRPETEMLVEKALKLVRDSGLSTVADIGTGSGAIAVALAFNLPKLKIYASDVSALALELAKVNSRKQGVQDKISFLLGDLLAPLPGPVDLIIANLPYVKESDLNEPSIIREPRQALDGGLDGLNVIRRFILQIKPRLNSDGSLLMEIGQGQSDKVRFLLQSQLPLSKIEAIKDYNGIERVIICRY
jgi:release factor glutamine methyltransferase